MFRKTIFNVNRAVRWFLTGLITCYQRFLSPFLGDHCRFYPSCSHYAKDAIVSHGIFKGLSLACRRILRCHPFNLGGFDPVPNTERENNGL